MRASLATAFEFSRALNTLRHIRIQTFSTPIMRVARGVLLLLPRRGGTSKKDRQRKLSIHNLG
jgi:hypothetical protein